MGWATSGGIQVEGDDIQFASKDAPGVGVRASERIQKLEAEVAELRAEMKVIKDGLRAEAAEYRAWRKQQDEQQAALDSGMDEIESLVEKIEELMPPLPAPKGKKK